MKNRAMEWLNGVLTRLAYPIRVGDIVVYSKDKYGEGIADVMRSRLQIDRIHMYSLNRVHSVYSPKGKMRWSQDSKSPRG